MRGHLKKRATWEFVVDLGLQPLQRCPVCRKRFWLERERLKRCPRCRGPLEDGEARRQELHTGYKTKRDAERAMAQVVGAIAAGTHIESSKVLVGDFLRTEWLPAIRPTIRETTFISYKGHVEYHLVPAFGSLPLQQLTGAHLNAYYAKLLSQPTGKKERKLSPSTVRRIHATLHRALKDAVRWGRLGRNPADAADPPRALGCGETPFKVWSVTDIKKFLGSESQSAFYPLWLTLVTTGMRRGEALGLRWCDVDENSNTLAIRQTRVLGGYQPLLSTPKTKRGRRLVALDPATSACLADLRVRREEEARGRGEVLRDTDYAFTALDGTPIHPERVTRLFRRAIEEAGVPLIRLHDLRHTHATLALSAGVHAKVVSERLGHANIGITLDTYSHCLPALSEEAACRVAGLILTERKADPAPDTKYTESQPGPEPGHKSGEPGVSISPVCRDF